MRNYKYLHPRCNSLGSIFGLYLVGLFLLNVGNLMAQNNNIIFERINTSDGLSNNGVNTILQDSKGYLWVATSDGLNKYDGYSFTTYRNDPQDTSSISNNSILPIHEDRNGNLWIGTEDGLNLYNREKESFTTFRYTSPATATPQTARWLNSVIGIVEDADANLWLATVFNGLVKFETNTKVFSTFLPDSTNSDGANSNVIFRIIPESNTDGKKIWLGGWVTGLLYFDSAKKEFTKYRHDPKNPRSLSNDEIRGLFQDSKGMLWIGTFGGGLNKFDPVKKEFVHYMHEPENPASLSNNNVWSIYEDPNEKGILWIGTEGGLNKFDINTNTFSVYKSDISDPGTLSSNFISEIYYDQSGVRWIGTAGGLNKIDPGRVPFRHYNTTAGKPGGLNSNEVFSIAKSASEGDVLWIGTYNGGLNKFDRSKNTFSYYKKNPADPNSINGDSIRSLYEDPDEAGEVLWVGTSRGGLNRFDIENKRFKHYKYDANNPNSISGNLIRRIYETRDGLFWIATSTGLNKFDRDKEIFTRFLPQDTTYVRDIHTLVVDLTEKRKPLASILKIKDDEDLTQSFELTEKTKVLTVALGEGSEQMWDYGWLEKSDSSTVWKSTFEESKHAGGDDKNRIQIWTGILEPGKYNLRYISDDSHSFDKWNAPAPINPNMWGIQIFEVSEQEKNLVVQNINKFEKPNSVAGSNTTCIIEDTYGMLWIGTLGSGLSKFDRKTGKFTNYTSKPGEPGRISSNIIQSLHEDKNGVLWIGTRNGLNKYDSKNNSFAAYYAKDGLPNNVIFDILEDNDHNLWLATNNGISKFNPDDLAKNGHLTFINYNIQDGLQYNQYYMGSSSRGTNGELFFGGYNGVVSFFPGRTNPQPPRTHISRFSIFNESVEAGENSPLKKHISETNHINLSFDQNMFAFEFTALHFSRPEKNLYLYKMEGFDKDWIDGSRRYAPYTNLDPGEYTFRVKAANSDGVWDEKGAAVSITIAPPWWRTITAYILYGLFLILSIFIIDRVQRRRLLAKTKERMKIQAAEHRAEAAELQARVAQAENDRKTRELEEARDLQLSMLPKNLPQLPHLDIAVYMKTATEVGGDYYDFHVGLDGTLTVVIGDATGHGMKAGTMVTTAKSLFNSYAPNPDILYSFQEITRCIKQMNLGKMSMCMTMLKIKGDTMLMSSAGMPPSFIFRRDTRIVEEHLMQGMPLGTMDKFPYKIEDTTLNPGDTILLLSDGLPELQNGSDELYGYKRVRDVFEEMADKNPEEIITYFKDAGSAWVNDNNPDDDVTFVVIKVRE